MAVRKASSGTGASAKASKKAPAKKKAATKKAAAKKAPAKEVAAKKAPAKKAASKKAVAKKAPAAPKKAAAKKAPTKKVAAKKVAAKKAPAKAVAPGEPVTKKAPTAKTAKRAVAKTAPAQKAPARKPATAKPADSAAPAAGRARIFSGPQDVRILVVDDEPEVLALLVPFLKTKGYAVSEASDGDQALEKILLEHPNVVVLDVMMPGLSGWEISRYVRERSELDPVRIIMATGIGKETNAATSPLYGADAYLDKPFRLDALERTVEDVIRRIEAGEYAAPELE